MPKVRNYPKLPVIVSHWMLGIVIQILQARGLWNHLTADMAIKVGRAYESGNDLTIWKEDLDMLPDDAWSKLEALISEYNL